ncbi:MULTISPECIES: hypothetical protein [Sorangium]|uniref:Secreted protein n=1 Tax=Sorangium cellulosum TaxID=56 RepID=A0A4P2R5X3_SORCE|nr:MULTISPECIES: hypothetical protein [Sorangium]AUX38540.1 hypothetical protein SOCE836_107840 [Sorangium cellulosum]WCQ97826.1 hypothetical protein NQZ70_10624 [Sorangium sp. Soce836]
MDRSVKRYIFTSLFLLGSLPIAGFLACDRPPTGGECTSPIDCWSNVQTIPGTTCAGNACVCIDPTERICCKRGSTDPACLRECLPCDQCAAGTPGCEKECVSDAECPGPPSPRCGTGRCVDGLCEVEIHEGRIDSQVRGDCMQLKCTAKGELIVQEEQEDTYDDGNLCTTDRCDHERPYVRLIHDEPCSGPGIDLGVCAHGVCVECLDTDPMLDCPSGLACDGTRCVPGHCVNNRLDAGLGETDLDCGGACRPCATGLRCARGSDCQDRVCRGGVCASPTCADGMKNGDETGVDCGKDSCSRCPVGEGCARPTDCASGVCWAGVCQAPTCTDGVENGNEGGIDCGGEGCELPCRE